MSISSCDVRAGRPPDPARLKQQPVVHQRPGGDVLLCELAPQEARDEVDDVRGEERDEGVE